MKHLTRILSLLLVMALVIAVAPNANAFTITEKSVSKEALPAPQEAGGNAPTLNAGEDEYNETDSEKNKDASTAEVVQPNSTWAGYTSAAAPIDFFKITLDETSDIMFVSVSTYPTMYFGVYHVSGGDPLATCEYYGQSEDGLFADAILVTLEAGTYYVLVAQATFSEYVAYDQEVIYAIDFHVHDYTVTHTKAATCAENGIDTYTCDCGFEKTVATDLAPHNYVKGETVAPTCTVGGYTVYECTVCETALQDDFVDPLGHELTDENLVIDTEAKTHSYTCARCEESAAEPCTFEEDPATGIYHCSVCGADAGSTVYRISGKTRIQTSMAIADALKEELGGARFDSIIVASSANFPDALTGSYLAAVKNAPILLTNDSVHADVVSYITLNMDYDGKVYILGGTGAVSQDFEDRLIELGIDYERLSGKNRYLTNLKILEAAGVDSDSEILICTGTGFADSLSASATGLPIMLVGKTLTAEQKEFLAATSGRFVIIGGSGVVSTDVENELNLLGTATVQRLSGKNRYATSTLVAERFFPDPSFVVLAYAQNYPDGLCGGPLSYAKKAPLILTDGNSSWANDYMAWRDIEGGYVLGGNILVEDNTVRSLFDMLDNEPIPKKR